MERSSRSEDDFLDPTHDGAPDASNTSEKLVVKLKKPPGILKADRPGLATVENPSNGRIAYRTLEGKPDAIGASRASHARESCYDSLFVGWASFPNTPTSCNKTTEANKAINYYQPIATNGECRHMLQLRFEDAKHILYLHTLTVMLEPFARHSSAYSRSKLCVPDDKIYVGFLSIKSVQTKTLRNRH